MIKKIENGDISQTSGGLIVEVAFPNNTNEYQKECFNKGQKYVIKMPDGSIYTSPLLDASQAKRLEHMLFGDEANTKQYRSVTGKMVDF